MKTRLSSAQWKGSLKEGEGTLRFSQYEGAFNYLSRFEEGEETNPEELVGAAHAGCFSMFLAALMGGEGLSPERIETTASVTVDRDETGPCIQKIELNCTVVCDGLSQENFQALTAAAKSKCPISRLYEGGTASLELNAVLK